MEPGKGRPRLIGRSLELDDGPVWVTSSGLITSRLGQVSLTKPTYRRIVLRCCSVPQAKPSPDYEYRISLRPHPVGHPSIRSARPPIITVMSGLAAPDHHPSPALAAEVIVGGWPFPLDLPAGAPRLKWLHQRPAGGAKGSHLP